VRRNDHAVVVGASMAGLVAARALANHFERVTIVERDVLPDGPVIRAGVPQARHVHVLLLRGAGLLEGLFPGLDAELAAAGAPSIDWTTDARLFNFGSWKQHFPSGLTTHQASRELLEWTIRGRILAYPGVRFVDQTDVTGVEIDKRGRATGVRIRPRGRPIDPDAANGAADEDEIMAADLVVNAAGREARGSQWLATLGYPEPSVTRVNSHLGYATRSYRPPDGFSAEWKALIVAATPPASRGAVLMPLEGGRWIVTLAGSAGDYPPTDEPGFLAFLRSLPTPLLADALDGATPTSGIVGYRRTENMLHDYARLPRYVERFVSIGDAVCALNPVYGQGMTVSANAVTLLDTCLREQADRADGDMTGLAKRFQRRLARVIADPWLLATGEDLRYPETTGAEATLAMRITRPYLDQVMMLSRDDPSAYRTVVEVLHLLKPPRSLFRPGILARVLPRLVRRVSARRLRTLR
jgi:2-polyprenyl-6-methoxyphenol hydroxylase-like FAD-dependent oxidoreductase